MFIYDKATGQGPQAPLARVAIIGIMWGTGKYPRTPKRATGGPNTKSKTSRSLETFLILKAVLHGRNHTDSGEIFAGHTGIFSDQWGPDHQSGD